MHIKVYGLFNNKKWVLFNSLCVSLNINVLHTKAYNNILALGIFCCKEYEEIYLNIDDVKSKGKKRAIADERIENGGSHHRKRIKANRKITIDGRRLLDGITATGQKNKRGSDVSSDGDIVDENNSLRLTSDTLKENSIHKSCHLSQSHSLGAARCIDGMRSQGTITANKYGILMEKIQ
uniref:Uncharacterized protein n=1 Tax=Strongyloides venezuelensis TaxID=75913 RepID=A0A0K0FTU7_STRVS